MKIFSSPNWRQFPGGTALSLEFSWFLLWLVFVTFASTRDKPDLLLIIMLVAIQLAFLAIVGFLWKSNIQGVTKAAQTKEKYLAAIKEYRTALGKVFYAIRGQQEKSVIDDLITQAAKLVKAAQIVTADKDVNYALEDLELFIGNLSFGVLVKIRKAGDFSEVTLAVHDFRIGKTWFMPVTV